MTITIVNPRKSLNVMILLVTGFCLLLVSCSNGESTTKTHTNQEITYDSLLAEALEADEYGMHQYVMAFWKKGPNRSLDSVRAMELQMAHLENIGRMADNRDLLLAGPFLDTGDLRGIYIFDVKTIEEAEALTKTDPAIQAGSLIMELKPWYGSAALMELNQRHKRVTKTHF